MEMYYIALIPPAEINNEVLKWKQWMKEKHGCVVAHHSPGHITLVPPFPMNKDLENDLINDLDLFASSENEFLIRHRDFSHFKSRVIYMHVEENSELNQFRDRLFGFFKDKTYPTPEKEESFHPHITIASRDLDKVTFNKAWEHFKILNYKASWTCSNISLLRHNKKNWDVIHTSQFNNRKNKFYNPK